MSKYILLSEKNWHQELVFDLQKLFNNDEWVLIRNREDFNIDFLNSFRPDKIFIPHWSYIIKEDILLNYECIIFHMTDLPFGRGGSPLQNLILRGFKGTKISALRATNELDAGPIYLKNKLSLDGSAQEIFERATIVIREMIFTILSKELKPVNQQGEVVKFERRKPEQSNLENVKTLEKFYDHVRMLDAEGYPKAFIQLQDLKIEFSKIKKDSINSLSAHVRIFQK